jgi:hypothetical protein
VADPLHVVKWLLGSEGPPAPLRSEEPHLAAGRFAAFRRPRPSKQHRQGSGKLGLRTTTSSRMSE